MAEPYNYMLNVPDPTQSVVSGVQRGIELAALMDERQIRQAKIEKQKRLENAISSLGDNPTVEQIGAIMRNNPDISGEFTTLYNALSESEQQERLGQAQRSYAATLQGRPDIAAQILNEAAVAYENAGRANDAKAMRDQAALVEADPNFSKTVSGLFLASAMGPEKFAQSFSNFESARVSSEQARVAEGTSGAQIAKAKAEATVAGINANFQEQLVKSLLAQRAAAIEASGATAEEARANAEAQRTATEQAARGILPVGERPAAENTLRNEYLTQTKPYRDIKAAYDRVSAAQPTPVGDIALVFSYMKMLDPGSVVREGEFATASNAGGIPTRIINLYNKAVSGDILTDGQRAKMRSQARELLKKTEQDEKQIRGGVERIAKSRGLNVDNIFYDFTAPTGGGEQPAASGDVVDTSNPLLQ
jgi:hypothetical protein